MAARKGRSVDVPLVLLLGATLLLGLVIFFSAALGFLARSNISVLSIALNHVVLGIGLGIVVLFIASRIHYRRWRAFAPHLFAAAVIASALVFVPFLGLEANGARRWILLGPLSLQPAEALKIAAILAYAAYIAKYRVQLGSLHYGIGGFLAIIALPAAILLLQPDTGTLGVIIASLGAMFIAAGARVRDIALVGLISMIMLLALIAFRPYVLDRITTFLNPLDDPRGSSYQIRQSLIAVGSGGLTGRGFGQSVQKFSYLPEPMSDSIFAVAAEEFGLIGSLTLLGLFMGIATRGFSIAARAPDYFGAMLAVGITTYLVGQAFLNIGAMLGLLPLTGIPLVFVSQGGTAMLVALGSIGILLNISRYTRS